MLTAIRDSIQETIQGCIAAMTSPISENAHGSNKNLKDERTIKVLRCFAEKDVAVLSPASKKSMQGAIDTLTDRSRPGGDAEIRKIIEDLRLKLGEA